MMRLSYKRILRDGEKTYLKDLKQIWHSIVIVTRSWSEGKDKKKKKQSGLRDSAKVAAVTLSSSSLHWMNTVVLCEHLRGV